MYVSDLVTVFTAVLIDSGSRYEVFYPSGISHFLEKLAFKVSYNTIVSFRTP